MTKQKKNPWLAAILNIALMGLCYVYVGKRVLFGVLLIITAILSSVWMYLNPKYIAFETLMHINDYFNCTAFVCFWL